KPRSLYARRHRHLTPREGETIPSLRQVIEASRAAKPDFRFFIELKTSTRRPSLSAPTEELAEAVVAELRRLSADRHTVLVGFEWIALLHAKRLNPTLTCWFTTERHSRAGAARIAALGGDGWFCEKSRATRTAIQSARIHEISFGVWTVNRPG